MFQKENGKSKEDAKFKEMIAENSLKQTEEDKDHMISLIYGIQETNQPTTQAQIQR